MPYLSISLLGPFTAELNGQPLRGFRSNKVRALLAYLAVESHRPWSRATLAGLLWSELPEQSAQSNLRNALSNLRKVIGDARAKPPFLRITETTLQINPSADCHLDLREFLDLASPEEARHGADPGRADISNLERALSLYRGEFLEGFSVDSAPFEEWILTTREQLRQKLLQALRRLALAHEGLGELAEAFETTRRYLELEPWDEAAYRYQMRILSLRDQRGAALALYETCCSRLARDLGIKPEAETVQLYEQIRDGRDGAVPHASLRSPTWTAEEALPQRKIPDFLTEDHLTQVEPPLFFARQPELELLNTVLNTAAHGQGRVYFVTGEPGSGKTALLAAFSRCAMQANPELVVAWGQCNAFTGQGDPYFPFLNILRMLAGEVEIPVSAGIITPQHAHRLWVFLPDTVEALLEQGQDLFNRFLSGKDLLSLARLHPGIQPHQYKRLQAGIKQDAGQPAQARLQQATLNEQFTRVLCCLAQRRPLVLVVDDLQWIDPGSVSLLFHMARQIISSRILILGAYRPEEVFQTHAVEHHPLQGLIHELRAVTGDIHIDLMQSEGERFIDELIDSEPNELSPLFRRTLYRHASGNPLFTIELLRGMQLRGEILKNSRGKWVEGEQLNWGTLPSRVDAVIARRIADLSDECQELLRVACVEGEQFTAEVVADILGKDPQRVYDLLSREAGRHHRLVTAQSLQRIGGQSLSVYRFRHSLFQIHLYNHLDVVEKLHLHGKIGTALEKYYLKDNHRLAQIAQALAIHFETAGMIEKSVVYYTLAGNYALQLSASRAAIDHYQQALHHLQALPASALHDWQALDLHLSLGPPITATCGWAAPELETNYRKIEEFCDRIEDDPRLVPALWLLAVYRLGRAEHATVDRLVKRLYKLAQAIGDPDLICLANLQVSPLYQGRLDEARQILARASLPRNIDQQRSLATRYGMSPSVVGLAYLAHCVWLLGDAELASQYSQEALELATQINVPMTLCYAIGRASWQHAFTGQFEAARIQAEKLLQITRQHGFRNYELGAQFLIAWVKAQTSDVAAEEIEHMYQSMETYQRLGTVLNRTTFLTLFAQACARAGQLARGLEALDESIAVGEKTGERWFEAETYRLKGEILTRQGLGSSQPISDLDAAESCFHASRQIANQQGARMLELRAVTSLCRLWQRLGKGKDGSQILSEIIAQFPEGTGGLDWIQAKALLTEL